MNKFLRESEKGFDRIDTEAGVIYGVKVLGPKSRNGRIYEDAAIRRAVPMYEGVTVNLNHQRIESGSRAVPDRQIQDRWGVLRNARYAEGSVYADLHYLKNHPMTPQLIEAADRFPDTFGLSHDAAGDEQVIDGERRVIELFEIRSVDVVAEPATNNGLFECCRPSCSTSRSERKQSRLGLLEVKDGDGDGMINDGKSSQAPAPKQPKTKLSQADRVARAERRAQRYERMAGKAYSRGKGYIDTSKMVSGPMSDRIRARGDEFMARKAKLMSKSSRVKQAISKVSQPKAEPQKLQSKLTQADKIKRAERRADRYDKQANKLYDKGNDLISQSNQVWGAQSDKLYAKGNAMMRKGDPLTTKATTIRNAIKKVSAKQSKPASQ
jgi:hypothetical protein